MRRIRQMLPLAPIEPHGGMWDRGAAGAFEILSLLARSCDNPDTNDLMVQVCASGAKQPEHDVSSRDFAMELLPEAAGRSSE
jgi:hypothetical protein